LLSIYLHVNDCSASGHAQTPSYVAMQEEIVAAILVVLKKLARNPPTGKLSNTDHWKLVCVEMKEQEHRLFMETVERGLIPDDKGLDSHNLVQNWERVKLVYERNILKNPNKFRKRTGGHDIVKVLQEWNERLNRRQRKGA